MHRGRRPSHRRALRNLLLSLGVGVALDVRMAGMSGVDVRRQLATAGVAIPTVVRGSDENRARRPASTPAHGSTSSDARAVTDKRGQE